MAPLGAHCIHSARSPPQAVRRPPVSAHNLHGRPQLTDIRKMGKIKNIRKFACGSTKRYHRARADLPGPRLSLIRRIHRPQRGYACTSNPQQDGRESLLISAQRSVATAPSAKIARARDRASEQFLIPQPMIRRATSSRRSVEVERSRIRSSASGQTAGKDNERCRRAVHALAFPRRHSCSSLWTTCRSNLRAVCGLSTRCDGPQRPNRNLSALLPWQRLRVTPRNLKCTVSTPASRVTRRWRRGVGFE